MQDFSVTLNEDEALVLLDCFENMRDGERIDFAHRAEYLALRGVGEQLKKARDVIPGAGDRSALDDARARLLSLHEVHPDQTAFDGF